MGISTTAFSDGQRQTRNLKALLKVAQALATEIRLDDLLQVIVQEAADVLDADRATLFLYDESRNELWSKTTQKLEIKEIRVPLGLGIAGTVASTRTPINISDTYADARFNPDFDRETGYRTRSILCMPLISNGDRLIGVVQVLNKKDQEAFDEADEALLSGLSAHITVALERARLIEAYVEKERMEETLKLAHDIQMSMLPKVFPAFPDRKEFDIFATLVPAKEVAGDFYDFFFIDDNHLCFAIGDVSGKGVPASLFMAVTKTLFKAIASTGCAPGQILARLNNEICRDNEACMFVTLFCAIIDIRTGEIVYSNGGHNRPYHLHRDGVRALESAAGRALGLVQQSSYSSGRIVLKPGEALLLYTDGITEAVAPDEALYSDARLSAFLVAHRHSAPRQLIDELVRDVRYFAGAAAQSDDITVLALRYFGTSVNMSTTLEIKLTNKPAEIERLSQVLGTFGARHGLAPKVIDDLNLALEEILSNAISFAYTDNREHEIRVCLKLQPGEIRAEVEDDGQPFNPLEVPEPDISKPLQERPVGGLGIHLVRKLMDGIDYRRASERNLLTVTKKTSTP
jgi:serine phosphatase RsbU (regulator of sigma subunit)/anti-sigma regulatory factor (Ser/Thr protein kinase)